MPSNKRRVRSWLRFQLWEVLVFTSLIAALFGVGRMIDSRVIDVPDASQVSLSFAKTEIAGGNVVEMNLQQVDDVVVGYATLSAPVVLNDSEETSAQSFVVVMRHSDGSATSVLKLLESRGVSFSLFRSTRAFTLTLPLFGAILLTLAALLLLRFRNRAAREDTPISDS